MTSTGTIKKINALGIGFTNRGLKSTQVWIIELEGSIFCEYPTKKAALADARKYNIRITK